MIDTTHTLVGPAGASAPRSPLVDQLARRADADHDGQVTSAEFASFLSELMQSLDDDLSAHRASTIEPRIDGRSGASPAATAVDAVALTPAQGAALLERAFASAGKVR